MTTEKQPFASADAEKLLDLLGSDDAFRQLFVQDLPQAMAQISEAAATACKTCQHSGPLASKEEFQQARGVILQHLATVAAFYVPHCFMAGRDGSPAP